MKEKEVAKLIYKLEEDINNYYWASVYITAFWHKVSNIYWQHYYVYNLSLFYNWDILDIKWQDITFEKLKPQIKKILWEYFWFWWRVRNLFR